MQQRDLDFAVWCAKKCLHLWDAPKEVKEWLANPKPEAAWAAAWAAEAVEGAQAARTARAAWAAWAAWWAAEATEATRAAWAAWAARAAVEAARAAAVALGVPVGQLRLDYVTTWTEDELSQASGDWIEPATVEIFERRARHAAA